MKDEIWKDVEGYEGVCQVSSTGRIRTLDRLIKNGRGTMTAKKGIIKSPSKNTKGYPSFGLAKDGVTKPARVHREVAKAFIPNPENKPQVNHIDGDKLNNHVENLEWCTNAVNMQLSWDTGLRDNMKGSLCTLSKLDEIEVMTIVTMFNAMWSSVAISKYFNVKPACISDIKSGRTWTHITKGIIK